jgi:hypothetical protein
MGGAASESYKHQRSWRTEACQCWWFDSRHIIRDANGQPLAYIYSRRSAPREDAGEGRGKVDRY